MSDFLQNPMVKQIAKSLNLPLPIPALLNRNNNGYSKNEWQTKKTAFVTTTDEDIEAQKILHVLKPYINETSLYQDKIDAVIISGLAIENIEMSVEFFTKAQLAVQKLNKNARVVVLSKRGNNTESITIQKSFEGFSRALSKELGKNGTTVNHLVINEAPAENVAKAILYFISDKSSFITGQVVSINNTFVDTNKSLDKLLNTIQHSLSPAPSIQIFVEAYHVVFSLGSSIAPLIKGAHQCRRTIVPPVTCLYGCFLTGSAD